MSAPALPFPAAPHLRLVAPSPAHALDTILTRPRAIDGAEHALPIQALDVLWRDLAGQSCRDVAALARLDALLTTVHARGARAAREK